MTLFFAPQIERPAERVRFCLLTRPRGDGTRAAVCSRCGTRGCVCGWTIKLVAGGEAIPLSLPPAHFSVGSEATL